MPQISLLTSHYSVGLAEILESFDAAQLTQQQRLGTLGHYHEAEAAIVANRLNTELSEVVVVYDSVTPQDNCTHLAKRLDAALLSLGSPAAADFVCVDRVHGQPSYREMFEYASRLQFKGKVVVMGNTDGATDSTIGRLSGLQKGVVVVLSATGQFDSPEGAPVARVYEKLVGPLCAERPTSRCLVSDVERQAAAQKAVADGRLDEWRLFTFPERLYSWDAYAFRPPLPPLSQFLLPDEIFMNHIGGENRAGLALMHALGTPSLPNACGHINWHHLHCNAKAHAAVPRRRTSVGLTLQEYTMLQRSNTLQTALRAGSNVTTMPVGRRAVDATRYTMRFVSQLEETADGLGTDLRVEDTITPFSSGCTRLEDCMQLNSTLHTEMTADASAISDSVDSTDSKLLSALLSRRLSALLSKLQTSDQPTSSIATTSNAFASRMRLNGTVASKSAHVVSLHSHLGSYSYLLANPDTTATKPERERPFVPAAARDGKRVPWLHMRDEPISLFTTHRARGMSTLISMERATSGTVSNPLLKRYLEAEAAIVANRLNTELSEVVVVYDSVTPQDNCTHLAKRLDAALLSLGSPAAADFVCVDRVHGQPSYREMFEYASRLQFKGKVVVMGNTDGATDSTIGRLSGLQKGVVVVLSATGQFDSPEGAPVARVYEKLVGPLCAERPTSRCLVSDVERHAAAQKALADGRPDEWRRDRFPEQLYSWDAYAFRPPLPPLSEHILPPSVSMDSVGGANRAGLALMQALGSSTLIFNQTLPNACGHVNVHKFRCGVTAGEHALQANVGMRVRNWTVHFPQAPVPSMRRLGFERLDEQLNVMSTEIVEPWSTGCKDMLDCMHTVTPPAITEGDIAVAALGASTRAPGRVVLHVGDVKTGSTYLQHLFHANRRAMLGNGVLYPGVSLETNQAHHYLVADACQCNPVTLEPWGSNQSEQSGPDFNAVTRRAATQRAQALHATLGTAGKLNVILSSEMAMPAVGEFATVAPRLRVAFTRHGQAPRIVYVYRNLKEIKYGAHKTAVQYFLSTRLLADYLSPEAARRKALLRLQRLVAVFGEENIGAIGAFEAQTSSGYYTYTPQAVHRILIRAALWQTTRVCMRVANGWKTRSLKQHSCPL